MSGPLAIRRGALSSTSSPKFPTSLKQFHLCNHSRRFILQPSPLICIVLLGIFPSQILEVQIPKVLVDNILPLPQIIRPRLIRLHKRISLRPEDESEQRQRQHHTCNHAHVSTPSPAECALASHHQPSQAQPSSQPCAVSTVATTFAPAILSQSLPAKTPSP